MAELEQLLIRIQDLESNPNTDQQLIPLYYRVLKIAPKDRVDLRNGIAFNLSWSHCAVGNHAEATRTLRQLIRLGYNPPDVYQNLAHCFSHMGDEEQAVSVGEEGLQQHPSFAGLHEVVGDAKRQLENYRGAIHHYHLALEAHPPRESTRGIYEFTVYCLKELDEWHVAKEVCVKWLREFPRDSIAMFQMAESLYYCIMPNECIDFIRNLIRRNVGGFGPPPFLNSEDKESLEFLKCRCHYRLAEYEYMREITTRHLRLGFDGPQIPPSNRWYKMHTRVLFLSRNGISHEQAFTMLEKALRAPIDDVMKRGFLKKALFALVLLPNSILATAKSKLIASYRKFVQVAPYTPLVTDMLRMFAILDFALGDIGYVTYYLRELAKRVEQTGEVYQVIRRIAEMQQRLDVPRDRIFFHRTWADGYKPPQKRLKIPKRQTDPDLMDVDEGAFADAPIPLSGEELRRALVAPPPPARFPFQKAYFFAFDRSSLPEDLKHLVTKAYRMCS